MNEETNNIILNQLSVGYGTRHVLIDINLTLSQGQLVCLMGPNGSGKSTLLRTMAGFQKPLKGTIRLNGQDLGEMDKKAISRNVSVVLTDQLNAGQMTGKEIVAAGRYPYIGWLGRLSRQDNRILQEAMEQTDTVDLSDRHFFEMSDGQRQKIMIARALCQQTPVILLDEPTAHLDLNNRVAVVMLLGRLARENKCAILMTTHELDLSLQLADRIWLAEMNATVHEGFPEDMVLNGQIDKIFQFKGYDLKTGTVKKAASGRKVSVKGEGFLFLWTANAFERHGYVIESGAERSIIINDCNPPAWEYAGIRYSTLESLLEAVNRSF